jgi:hypothetical protein
MFYQHFGHIRFYHPRLLCFFLDHVGFAQALYNSHGVTAQQASLPSPVELQSIQPRLPVSRKGIFWRMLRAVQTAAAKVFLRPYLDLIQANFRQIEASLAPVDPPWECYAKAVKPSADEKAGSS